MRSTNLRGESMCDSHVIRSTYKRAQRIYVLRRTDRQTRVQLELQKQVGQW